MKAKEIWAVVPFCRPQWLTNVKNNFYSQKFTNKKLVIVENGEAVGYCKSVGFEPDLLLTSEKHQAIAKATALNELKRCGAEYWTTWDDDDYYGSDYMTEVAEHSNKANLIGKMTYFVKTYDDELRLFVCDAENSDTQFIHGPTISGWVSEAVEFKNVGRWSEDIAFCEEMKMNGATVYATSRWHFINQRHKGNSHTWIITTDQMSQSWYHTVEGAYVLQYNCDMDEARSFVSKKSQEPKSFKVQRKPHSLKDFAAYTYVRKNSGTMENWMKKAAKEMGLDKKLGLT